MEVDLEHDFDNKTVSTTFSAGFLSSASKKLAGTAQASKKLAGSLAGVLRSQARLAHFQNFQTFVLNDDIVEDNVSCNLQLNSSCCFAQ